MLPKHLHPTHLYTSTKLPNIPPSVQKACKLVLDLQYTVHTLSCLSSNDDLISLSLVSAAEASPLPSMSSAVSPSSLDSASPSPASLLQGTISINFNPLLLSDSFNTQQCTGIHTAELCCTRHFNDASIFPAATYPVKHRNLAQVTKISKAGCACLSLHTRSTKRL